MDFRKRFSSGKVICVLVFMILIAFPLALGYAQPEQSGYLTYEDPAGQEESSVGSTVAYLFSLFFVFLFVLGLAYLVSKFIAQKSMYMRNGHTSKILDRLPLGTNQGVYVIEMAGKVLLIGVTGQQITLLQEIVDSEEIQKLHSSAEETSLLPGNVQQLFKEQIASLNNLSQRIPAILRKDRSKEKR